MFQSMQSLIIGILTLFLVAQTHAKSSDMAVYWGQNRYGVWQQPQGTHSQEPSLETICAQSQLSTVILNYIEITDTATNETSGLKLRLDPVHCRGEPCPDIGRNVTACQAMNKIVVGAVMLNRHFKSQEDAYQAAIELWQAYLGGRETEMRPLGAAVLDGVDLWLRGSFNDHLADFTHKLRSLMRNDTLKPYTLFGKFHIIYKYSNDAVSPRCVFPDTLVGPVLPGRLLSAPNPDIDGIIVHLGSSQLCTFHYEHALWQTLHRWESWRRKQASQVRFWLAIPSADGYVDAAPGDYVPPTKAHNLIRKMTELNMTGLALFEASSDWFSDPVCTGERYSELLSQLINGSGHTVIRDKCNEKSPLLPSEKDSKRRRWQKYAAYFFADQGTPTLAVSVHSVTLAIISVLLVGL